MANAMISLRRTNKEMLEAYAALKLATINHFTAQAVLTLAIKALSSAKNAALASGAIEGKNEKERDAALAVVVKDEQAEVDRLQADAKEAELAMKLAELDVDACRVTVRILEVHVGLHEKRSESH